MYKLEIKGEIEIINENDLPELIEKHMGIDTAEIVKELIEDSDYNNYKAKTDLISYDMQLTHQNDVAMEIKDTVIELIEYLEEANRINRLKIKKELKEINNKLNSIL